MHNAISATSRSIGWIFMTWLLESAMQVSSLAYAPRWNFRGLISRVRHGSFPRDFFNTYIIKRNWTYGRRKRIIPPTFPPYKNAWRREDTMALCQACTSAWHHLFHGKKLYSCCYLLTHTPGGKLWKRAFMPLTCCLRCNRTFLSPDSAQTYHVLLHNALYL